MHMFPSGMLLALTLVAASAHALNEEKTKEIQQVEASPGPVTSNWRGKIGGSLRLGTTSSSVFPLDSMGTTTQLQTWDSRLRLAPEVQLGNWLLLSEFDVASGPWGNLPPEALVTAKTPVPAFRPLLLRQLFVEYKGSNWMFRVGQQATPWGLGLLANSGAKDAQPGDFGESRWGDLTYRALLAGRPFASRGGSWQMVEPIAAFEWIERDDFASLASGERAFQGILAVRMAKDANRHIGAYVVYRQQTASKEASFDRQTRVWVADLAGKWLWGSDAREWMLGFETVSILGNTTMARSDTAPEQTVRQFGGALKSWFRSNALKYLFDAGFASGDQNPYDDVQQAFRFDPDFRVGLVLFDKLMGWQSARSAARAGDPSLVGVAPDGVDLVSNRGSVSGAFYLFPRVSHEVVESVHIYGGPLFAWSTARLADPFNTRINGGTAVNSLGGRAGSYLGTELDIGLQYKKQFTRGFLLNATAEAGYLFPGDAFRDASGNGMAPVFAARIRLWAEL